MTLPLELYSVAQVRDIDARAIAGGTPGYVLMQRAGAAALAVLRSRWPGARRVAVVCGGGNNGGDGYVLARLAQAAGLDVVTLAASDPARLKGEAGSAFADFKAAGLLAAAFTPDRLHDVDVVVDALLGVGVQLPLRPDAAVAVAAMNRCGCPVLALDVPSGLDADRGVADEAVRASATISFIALKTGLFVGDGPDCTGSLLFDALGVTVPGDIAPRLRRLSDAEVAAALPRRPRSAHKASFGRVLIVGGGVGMPGAVRLAAETALHVGAGLVTVASLPEHLAPIVGTRPELMFCALPDAVPLRELLPQVDVVAIGPGLGRSAWAQSVLEAVLAERPAGQPLIVDADALNLIAAEPVRRRDEHWILTPHPGEAARLLGCTTAAVQADRLGALARLATERGGVIVLKGAGTLIAAPGAVDALCDAGNPGMAIPGMGDVLTGAIAGILGQCRDPGVAARAAVRVHALAGDALARRGERGLLAGEIAAELRHGVNATGSPQ